MAATCWDILDIEPTREASEIRRAYARALKSRRPDEDADSFQKLVEARAQALAWYWPDQADDADDDDDDESAEHVAEGDDQPKSEFRWHGPIEDLQNLAHDGRIVFVRAEDLVRSEPTPTADPVSDPASSLDELLRQLTILTGQAGSPASWEAAPWRSLMQSVADLDLARRGQFREAVLHRLLPSLPPLPPYEEVRAEYLADRGPAAIVDAVELELDFAQDQTKLAGTVGAGIAQLYLGWAAYARRDVPLLRRTPGQARVLAALDELTAAGDASDRSPAATWTVAAWRSMLTLLTGLPAGERDGCIGRLVASLGEMLPAEFGETVPVFISDTSAAAVVETIDLALGLSGADRPSLAAEPAFWQKYDAGVLAASRLRSTMQRAADHAYTDANGMPELPSADRGIWHHPRFEAYWDTARKLGRWPIRFDWRAFLFPLAEMPTLGIRPAWAFLPVTLTLLGVFLAATSLQDPSAEHWVTSAIVLSFLLLHLPAAFLYRRLAICFAMRRIRRADRDGVAAPDTRHSRIRTVGRIRPFLWQIVEVTVVLIALASAREALRPVDRERQAYESGTSLEASGKHAEAVAAFDRALQIDPENREASYSRAMSMMSLGDNEVSEAALTRAIKLDPDNLDLRMQRAYVLALEKRFPDALAEYGRILDQRPDNAAVFTNRGAILQMSSAYEKAIADYTHALALTPGFFSALRNRARCYELLGDYDRAIADQTDALAATTDDGTKATIFVERGWLRVEADDYVTAVADLRQAVAIRPSMQRARVDLGFAEFDTGAFGAAATDLEASFQPSVNLYALLFWHLAQARNGSLDSAGLASRVAPLAIKDWPGPVIDMFLGRQSPEALAAAASNDQERCEAAFYIGEWDMLQRQPGPAVSQFERALSTCPRSYIEYHAADAELHRLQP